ncbi:Carbonic anhydrase 2, partial [Smittium culicis]
MPFSDSVLKKNSNWAKDVLESKNTDYFKQFLDGQSPELLWIGCSDSRVASDTITGTGHTNCGGIGASLDIDALEGPIKEWLLPINRLYLDNKDEMD